MTISGPDDPRVPSERQLEADFEALYREFDHRGGAAVEAFVRGATKSYLDASVRANHLSIRVVGVPKERVANKLSKRMGWRKTLTGLTS